MIIFLVWYISPSYEDQLVAVATTRGKAEEYIQICCKKKPYDVVNYTITSMETI